MARGLDHFVLCVRDLDAAAEFYRRLGFSVGAKNRHPWGTENHIVQTQGTFLELLSMGPDGLLEQPQEGSKSFGGFAQSYLSAREGFAMLVLEGHDAQGDRRAFAQAGLGDYPVFPFAREGRRPDGSVVKVAFDLAFADDRHAPEIFFFTCQQKYPENFWNPAMQRHANGATGFPGVVMAAENPSAHAEFFQHFVGVHDFEATSAGLTIDTPRGQIEVLTQAAIASLFGEAVQEEPASLIGYRIAIADLDAMANRLTQEGIAFHEWRGRLIIPAREAFGVILVFEAP
jgi:catechol 2,3-dioxygenase-like lactoylglutathione lyase family enzyme